ncbi:MAG TPA: LLM class F420-dependent oxidoreductase [Acidimicrobiales bacterium]|jgi:probable F420-dependent oxidoreductase|nr:LLM class F420-dependent oxidoreductase [Acidimicrobiales bacterium]
MTNDLAGLGVWDGGLRYGDPAQAADAAAELEELGYTAMWIPDVGGDVFASLQNLLAATSTAVVATGILNMWMHTPDEVATRRAELDASAPGRLLLGIGVSHAALIDMQEAGKYQRPYSHMVEYLDALDAADPPVPVDGRVLAALGPKMLALAAARAAGVHPYLAPPDNTARTRAAVGPDALVCPEQPVVLERDPEVARQIARAHLVGYLALPNYRNNLLRNGIDESDLVDGGSDELVDTLVVWGDEDTIAARIAEHRAAGANHVCIQVLRADRSELPRAEWRRLAALVPR